MLVGFHPEKGGRTDIISPEFFISPDGQSDPHAELIATIDAMGAPVGTSPDQHAQCRFPARYLFLKSRDLLPQDTPEVTCPAYRKWLGSRSLTGATVIFASGHLTNPATFYGHMMLRLNTEGETGGNVLLDSSLNYGAIFPEDENGLIYVVRGLSGQYKSTWSNLPFYQHVYKYSDEQIRDVWEYRLDLMPDQTALIAAHAWEMKGFYNRYYFLRQNCAYRIAELVGLVLDEPVIPQDKPWVMPVDVLERLSMARNGDRPLLAVAQRIDSRQTRLRQRFSVLAAAEREAVKAYLKTPEAGVETYLTDLDARQQSRVLETLIDYFTVSEADGAALTTGESEQRRHILLARMRRPSGTSDFGTPAAVVAPHRGQRSSYVDVSMLSNSGLGEGAQIRFRPAFNDFLSVAPGALAYSELSFGDVRLTAFDGRIRLRNFDGLRLTTLNVPQSGLPDENRPAWRVRIGAEQEQLDCDDCLVGFAETDIGKSGWLGNGWVIFGMAGARLYGPDAVDGPAQLGLTGGLIHNDGGDWRLATELSVWDDFSGDGLTRSRLKFESRYRLKQNLDLSSGIEWTQQAGHTASEWRVGLSTYW